MIVVAEAKFVWWGGVFTSANSWVADTHRTGDGVARERTDPHREAAGRLLYTSKIAQDRTQNSISTEYMTYSRRKKLLSAVVVFSAAAGNKSSCLPGSSGASANVTGTSQDSSDS